MPKWRLHLSIHNAHKVACIGHFALPIQWDNGFYNIGVGYISIIMNLGCNGGNIHTVIGEACKAALHGQGIEMPGQRVVLEGVAEDGTIEAISIADAKGFALGVQWHAEYDPQTNPVNRALFQAFGEAVAAYRHAAAA